jgi:hypothetical protein
MANQIIGGDYVGYKLYYEFGYLYMAKDNISMYLNKSNLQSVELITEENKKKFIGAAGWALVGSVLLGPLGLIAGALVGGNKKEVTFACYLKDGTKFMVVADSKIYQKIAADCF